MKQFFYGGGIENAKQAKDFSQHADVVVVGNVIYDNFKEALKTVDAVKSHHSQIRRNGLK